MVSSSFFLPSRGDNQDDFDLYTIPSDHDAEASLTQSSVTNRSSKIRRSFAENPTPTALTGNGGFLKTLWNRCSNFYQTVLVDNDNSSTTTPKKKKRKDGNGTDNDETLVDSSRPSDELTTQQQTQNERLLKLAKRAHVSFVLGSFFYVVVAFMEVQWTASIQTIPVDVLRADDDATWQAYQRATKGHHSAGGQGGDENDSVVSFSMSSGSGQRALNTATNWISLPFESKHALVALGHNEETWDGDPASQLFWKSWDYLTNAQQAAATTLGLDQDSWNALQPDDVDDYYWYYHAGTNTPTVAPTFAQTEHEETEPPTTNHPTTSPTWQPTRGDGRTPWPTWEQPGDEKDQEEQDWYQQQQEKDQEEEATATTTTTTAATEEEVIQAPDSPEDWKALRWNYLPEEVRMAFESIGYNEEVWNTESSPFTYQLYWNELTSNQQSNASYLGYTQEGWDEARDANYPPQQQAMQITFKQETVAEPTPPPTPAPVASPIKLPTFQASTTAPGATKAPANGFFTTQPPATAKPTSSPTPKPTRKPTPFLESTYEDDLVIDGDAAKSEYYDDDIVLTIGGSDKKIWMSQILSIVGSIGLLVYGVLNWIREEHVFHVCMVQGALAMMLSAVAGSYSETSTLIFQTLAYHCYALEGFYMLRLRTTIQPLEGLDTLSLSLWVSDGLFLGGALVGVILGYWQFSNPDAVFEVWLAIGKLVSSCFWLTSAVICLSSTIFLSKKIDMMKVGGGGSLNHKNDQQEQEEEDCNDEISRGSRQRYPNGEMGQVESLL